jgi:hypothetical protein
MRGLRSRPGHRAPCATALDSCCACTTQFCATTGRRSISCRLRAARRAGMPALEEVLDVAIVARHYAVAAPRYLAPERLPGAMPLVASAWMVRQPKGRRGCDHALELSAVHGDDRSGRWRSRRSGGRRACGLRLLHLVHAHGPRHSHEGRKAAGRGLAGPRWKERHAHPLHSSSEFLHESVVHRGVGIDPLHRHARLAGAGEARSHCAFRGTPDVGVRRGRAASTVRTRPYAAPTTRRTD